MTPQALARLSALYDQAATLDESERQAWLARLAEEDAALAPGLRAMLAGARRETAELLDRGPAFGPAPGPAAGFAAGDDVGPYRLLRRLGEGGMGEVWLAERADGHLKRRVALKLPMLALRQPVLAQRFARERDILAALEHPNIARLFDAGLAADGQPYLALEYVEGRPITEHCEAARVDLRGRVGLIVQVARAVQHAHANLVIHRDLKPGNVLVRPDGRAMLLDFGIAKLIEDEQGEGTETELTRQGGRALTLGYAAPEQISGAPVSTATDVYSLGALLYELLAGVRPFVGTRREVEAAVLAQEGPPPPRGVPAALASIVLKALKKSPAERYPTADALAADLGRWLAGEAVLARPDTWTARALRAARRQRAPLAAAALVAAAYVLAIGLGAAAVVIALLGVALGVAVWLTRRATAERDRALALAERNAAVNVFLDALFTGAASAGALTPEQLLDRGERLVEQEVQGRAEHRAYVLGVLAGCWSGIGRFARAEGLLARALEAARGGADETLRETLRGSHAVAVAQLGRLDEAVATVDRALQRAGPDPELRARLHRHRSVLASFQSDGPATLLHAREALRWSRSAPQMPRHEEPLLLADLGWALLMAGEVDEADRRLAEAMRRLEALGLGASVRAVNVLNNWAHALQEMGDLPGSLALFDRALEVNAQVAPDSPPSPFTTANRAYTLACMGRWAEAEHEYRRCAEQTARQGDELVAFAVRMCRVQVLAEQGRADEAAQALADAEAACSAPVPADGAAAFAREVARGRLALARGDGAAALAAFGPLVQGDESAGIADALLGRAAALELLGRLEEATADARRALAIGRRWQGRRPASFRTALAGVALARLHDRAGRTDEARRAAREAWPQAVATLDPGHPALAQVRAWR